jgi:pimeloyl-ACP methyl ester carboxylesterase
MRSDSKNAVKKILALVVLLVLIGCSRPALVPYGLDRPVQVLQVVDAKPVIDGRVRFREIFCNLLNANSDRPDQTADCGDYLLRLADEPSKDETNIFIPAHNPRLRILVVPGLLGECIADTVVPFEIAMTRLRSLGYTIDELIVSGRSSSRCNADQIAAAIRSLDLADDEQLVLIGHSKGAVDILHFLVNHPETARRVSAVVSVAGAINGSPLASRTVHAYESLSDFIDLSRCEQGDGGALRSLQRSVRLNWLSANRLPETVQYFSMVAFTEGGNVNNILLGGYGVLKAIDPRNDGLLLFSDQVIPGARLLGYANADHWAIALPFEHKKPLLTKTLLNHNHFPREILLEAIVLYVAENLILSR